MKRFYYLFSLITVFANPTIVIGQFAIDQIQISNLVSFVIGITIIGSLWDIWATRHGRRDEIWLWQFNHKTTLGIYVFDLPIEEYLFYVSTSTYVIFIWEALEMYSSTGSNEILLLLVATTIWSLLFIGLPFVFHSKGDALK